MSELAAAWYQILSTVNAAASEPLSALADGIGLPLVSALLFGLIGATSPCQLTTNVSALAYLARGADRRSTLARNALAYLLGKALVYTLVGVAVIMAGQRLAQSSIPVIIVARKVLGPLMILLGLYLIGVLPLHFSLGQRISEWIEPHSGGGGARGAFLLGTAFSFAFCPTLFLLFFGLTIPLALSSRAGVVYPAVFALGTTLPLLALLGLVATGAKAVGGYVTVVRRVGAWLRPAAGLILVLAGLNDTFTYWLL